MKPNPIKEMLEGKIVIASRDDITVLKEFDVNNKIRSKPRGDTDFPRWDCWIEFQDLPTFNESIFK